MDATIGQQFGHTVGGHRRQKSTSRTSNSTENIYALGQPPTPRNRSFDNRHTHGHPYAVTSSMPNSNSQGFSAHKRRFPSYDPASDDRLEDLWALHGLGTSHLGAGIAEQLAASSLTGDDWNHSPSHATDMMDTSIYFDAAVNPNQHFTVDRSLQQSFDVHNPYNLFPLTEPHPADPEMDIIEDHLDLQEESPPSEEPETINRRSTSSDSNTTAGPRDPALQAEQEDHESSDHDEEKDTSSDHENHDGDKTQSSKPTVNNFVNKLHLMISDPKAAGFIWWTELGTSFVVSSAGEFSRSILGQHFKHNNFSSFVRQLNMYGFHKINRTPRNQRVQPDAQQWEFSHPKFLRGRQDLLDDIKRKPVEPDPSNARQRVELPSEVAAKLRQMSLDHEEVVNALQVERMKVAQLARIVKVLYDRLASSGPLGVNFPPELLNLKQPGHNAAKQNGMDLSGDSLVPSRTSASGRGRQAPTQTAATRASRRTRTDPEHIQEARLHVQKSNSTGVEGLSSNTRQATWSLSSTQNTLPNASRKPPDPSQLLQVKNETNVFVR